LIAHIDLLVPTTGNGRRDMSKGRATLKKYVISMGYLFFAGAGVGKTCRSQAFFAALPENCAE
jgi:hypothetical protein